MPLVNTPDIKGLAEFAAGGSGASRKRAFRARSCDKPGIDDYWKLMGYGVTGAGKTKAIRAFLEAGLKVFCLSTDFGGSGLSTVRTELKNSLLLANLKELEVTSHADVSAFIDAPESVMVEVSGGGDVPLTEWDPDLLAMDGGSNWQVNWVDDYVLDFTPYGNAERASEQRIAGLKAEVTDWDGIKRCTSRTMDKFLRLHNEKTGKRWHKYVTFQEYDPSEKVQIKGESAPANPDKRKKPLLNGGARSGIAGGFDLVIRMAIVQVPGRAPEYQYVLRSADALTKARGDLFAEDTIPADMGVVWRRLAEHLGGARGQS